MGITRRQLFKALGIVRSGPHLKPLTLKAMDDYERKSWIEHMESAPHGDPWHTSFHASAFPGAEKSCGRAAIYSLMDIPGTGPTPAKLRGQAEVGKAVEYLIVHRWGHAGLTIGGSVPITFGGNAKQLGFEHSDYWLTGSSDAVLDVRPYWDYVLPVDVKSKAQDVIDAMKNGARSYDEKHYYQIQAYIFLCQEFHDQMGWNEMGLKPAVGGTIFYASRQDLTDTVEFYVDADQDLIERATNNLSEWKELFLNQTLPDRPKEWRWTEEPCKWCPFKKFACKPDLKVGITDFSKSHGIEYAKNLRPQYDFEEMRKDVINRWMDN